MYCAECGSAMLRQPIGAWVLCCHGIGYWWNQAPLLSDRWIGEPQKFKGYWLYKTAKWPAKYIPVPPQLDNIS